MGGFSTFGTFSSVSQPEIVKSIHLLNVELEVIIRAVDVFYQIGVEDDAEKSSGMVRYTPRTKSVKGSRKFRCIFYCVFMAYNELDSPVDPVYAAELVGLPQNEIERAFNEYSPSGPMIIEPERLIRFYVNRINTLLAFEGTEYNVDVLVEKVTAVILTCRSTKVGQEWIRNTAGKIIAIVALYFYLNDIEGFDISQNISAFERACYLSWACIRRYHEQIIKYYNMECVPQVHVEINLPYMNGE